MYARAFVVVRRAAFVVGYLALYLVVYVRVYVLARCRWRYIQIISERIKYTISPVLFNKVRNCGFFAPGRNTPMALCRRVFSYYVPSCCGLPQACFPVMSSGAMGSVSIQSQTTCQSGRRWFRRWA